MPFITMSTSSHTTAPDFGEPWTFEVGSILTKNKDQVCDAMQADGTIKDCIDRACRITDCVNACQGMPDPAAEIQAMREAIREAARVLDKCATWPARCDFSDLANSALTKLQPFLP